MNLKRILSGLLLLALLLTGSRASAATLSQADQGFLNGVFYDDYLGADAYLDMAIGDNSVFFYTGMEGGFWLAAEYYAFDYTSSTALAAALRATAAVWANWATMETNPLLMNYDNGRVAAFNYAARQVEFYYGF